MTFEEGYKGLNTEQKKAVDTVEGPVMVIAGPGTGKTHILTLRIANILKQTQAKPSEILALTFADSAARTMRKRLAGVIGDEAAGEVMITTFHGFCEFILGTYAEHFPLFAARRPMSDVEQVLLFRELFDDAPSDELRPPKAPYTYLGDLSSLYETLTREGMSTDEYRAWAVEERERVSNDPDLQYVRGPKKGELKQVGLQKLKRYEKVDVAADLLNQYQALKDERNLYDFGDMLRVVIDGIAADDVLRATLQEQYQYVLADEHQDANALQHELLKVLAYDEHPNIFVVGDEKQAIYRFQGADVSGFRSFTELFPRATIITLKDSFRSLQSVLDEAHTIIKGTGDHAELTATRKGSDAGASLVTATDPLDEREQVAKLIEEKLSDGTLPHEIAVIARKNETADLFARFLEARGIPVLRAGDVSLTSRPIIRYILALMEYAADPTNMHAFRYQLLAPWWNTQPAEVMQLLKTSGNKDILLRLEEAMPVASKKLASIVKKAPRLTPIEAFSYLLEHSGARDFLVAHPEHFDDIPLLRALMGQLEEVSAGNYEMSFSEAVQLVLNAHEHNKNFVKQSTTMREGMVTVITVHKAKGMEFQYVFIPDLTESSWEKGGRADLIPSPFVIKESMDDALRNFYVAVTRAKDHVYLSYALQNKDGRERNPTKLLPGNLQSVERTGGNQLPVLHQTVDASALVKRMTKDYLTHEGLAPTALNEYMTSPPTFFARRILKMYEPETGPALLGSVVHRAIAYYLETQDAVQGEKEIEKMFARSSLQRGKVFDGLLQRAKESYQQFVTDEKTKEFSLKTLFIERKFETIENIEGVSVMLQGRIDAVFDSPDGAVIADFKTGTVSPKDEGIIRQLVFYGELLKANDHKVAGYSLIEVRPEGIKTHTIDAASLDTKKVLTERDDVIRELLSGSWRKGEPSEYDAILSLE